MVAERPFHDERFRRIDVAFDHEIGFGWNLEVAGEGLGEGHGCSAQEAGKKKLVDRRRQRRARRICRRRVGAQRDAHGHRFAAFGHLTPVGGADLVPLPVHRQRSPTRLHDTIHTDVPNPPLWIAGDHHRQGDVCTAVVRPALHQRKLVEVHLIALPHDLLRWRPSATQPGRELSNLQQSRQH
jgi:hypothetical protein